MIPYPGEIAALVTALFWSFTATFFALASQRIGSLVVNRIRLLLAVMLLVIVHWLLLGRPLPLDAAPERWFWLSLSGIVGLTLGDAFLLQAYVWIGPRLGMLLMSLAPVLSALLAWLFLGETLRPVHILGIALTMAGITWVVLERNSHLNGQPRSPSFGWGLLFGLGAATGQAVGLILAKKGLAGDFPALSGNAIRMVAAAGSLWLFTLVRGEAGVTFERLRGRQRVLLLITGGAFFGPFAGVWLSLLSIQLTSIGIASTLMALPPIFLLPLSYFIFKERFGWQAVAGTLVALGGVALLFLK